MIADQREPRTRPSTKEPPISAYDNDWVAEQMEFIDELTVSPETRDAMINAVLDAINALGLAAHYREVGCPLCGDKNVVEHRRQVLCNACERRLA